MSQVGHKVICIKDHSHGVVRRGQVFELLAIKKNSCHKCAGLDLNIGKPHKYPVGQPFCCSEHPEVSTGYCDGIWWLSSTIFAPYDDSLSETTAEDILQEIEELTLLHSANL